MDLLDPEKVVVNGRRYRFCDSNVWSNAVRNEPYQEDYLDDITDEACENEGMVIEEIDRERYKHSMDIPSAFHGYIVGCQGRTKKKIEKETQTIIEVPRKNTNDLVTLIGYTKASVISCRRRIELLMADSRKKIPYTHFVSIPLKNEDIVRNYRGFRDHVMEDPEMQQPEITESFTDLNKLHLTIGMLRLLDDREKKEAVETFNECVETIVRPMLNRLEKPLPIVIRGLDSMNDDPRKVYVLYAKVMPNEKLQELADAIFKFFGDRQVMEDDRRSNVKLHMTVLSTKKVEGRDNKRTYFNAEKIFETLGNYDFGESQLKTLEICERFAPEADGSYKTIRRVELA